MGPEDEGSDLWEWETPRGLFFVGPGSPVSVLGEMLGEFLSQLESWSQVVFPVRDRVPHGLLRPQISVFVL